MSQPAVDPAFKIIPRGSECFLIWRIEVCFHSVFSLIVIFVAWLGFSTSGRNQNKPNLQYS